MRGRAFVRRVQNILCGRRRGCKGSDLITNTGRASIYGLGVLRPIRVENAAAFHNATVVFKRSVACRRRNTARATSCAEDLVHGLPVSEASHGGEAVWKQRCEWRHPASGHLTMLLPSSAWVFTQL
jgi:hypothetical protein